MLGTDPIHQPKKTKKTTMELRIDRWPGEWTDTTTMWRFLASSPAQTWKQQGLDNYSNKKSYSEIDTTRYMLFFYVIVNHL